MILLVPHVYSVVAELDGRVVGSNFMSEDMPVAGIGPITVDPKVQNQAIGRKLMENVIQRAQQKRFASVRLVQAAFHNRSLSLYTKLGFDVKEPLATMQGPALKLEIPGYSVRPVKSTDVEACNELCTRIHGHARNLELLGAVQLETASLVEHNGRITGYTTSIGFDGHSVAETNEDLKALIGAADSFFGPGFHLPTRNGELYRWCLKNGLKVV
ncbi:MAG: GNAT family N-acetyltransferase, partial [Acidobacteria bacterium]|nr:GNAT family N-acetyltransferase [Acidobacteriota bacterium]